MKCTREQKRAVLLAQARALIGEFLDCEEQSEQYCISAPATSWSTGTMPDSAWRRQVRR